MKLKLIIILIIIIMIVIICMFFSREEEKKLPQELKKIDIFEEYHEISIEKINNMSLEEKIGQIFLGRLPEENKIEAIKEYKLGGYLFFEKDFKGKKKEEVQEEIQSIQDASNIPLLIAVDEEGGKVVRVSSNENIVYERFKASSELYELGGFERIKEDTIEKSNILYDLGINLNLAPVVDISTNPNDYIYQRTLMQNTELTSIYAKTVIEASKLGKVAYTLKHFPGYGGNLDTHKEKSVDNRSYNEIVENGIKPFADGIKAGAEAVLISHNIIKNIDPDNPASLSLRIHEILRNELGFSGVIITDDLNMKAVLNDKEAVIKAISAGNDLIIVTDYAGSIQKVKEAIKEGRIDEERINEMARKIIEWKCYKGMIN